MTHLSDLLRAPDLGPEAKARATIRLRYEDVMQDGTLQVSVLSAGLGASVWQHLLVDEASRQMRESGEIPILSRLLLGAGEGPISVAAPLEIEGSYRLSHGCLPSGEVERIYVEMWAEARAPRGHTFGPTPEPGTDMITCGRLYAEHVVTRLFAPKGERKVRRLDHPNLPPVPGPQIPIVPARATFALPEGAVALAPETSREIVLGIGHSDSNQHVSSLAYLRLAEDAALIALRAHASNAAPLAIESAELAYGKPSFGGEALAIVTRPFELTIDGKKRLGVSASFVEAGRAPEEGRTFVRLVFRAA